MLLTCPGLLQGRTAYSAYLPVADGEEKDGGRGEKFIESHVIIIIIIIIVFSNY